ncbi:hypothetical protein CBS101457_004399 [Exobasidium rhododendri]|nr:hypothetical protein CBS101457_004399 [Exobasidium rhododendri]
MSWNPFASSSNAAPATGGSGSWMNMETAQVRAVATGELTGEASAFEGFYKLSRKERIIGFVSCLVLGFALSLIGTVMLFIGLTTLFAVLYSIGLIISLIGSGFLVGFLRQLRLMFQPVRVVATGILFACLVMVWISAFVLNIAVLALIFVIILYLAYIWYTLSYIPYARSFVKSLVSKFV